MVSIPTMVKCALVEDHLSLILLRLFPRPRLQANSIGLGSCPYSPGSSSRSPSVGRLWVYASSPTLPLPLSLIGVSSFAAFLCLHLFRSSSLRGVVYCLAMPCLADFGLSCLAAQTDFFLHRTRDSALKYLFPQSLRSLRVARILLATPGSNLRTDVLSGSSPHHESCPFTQL